MNVRCVCYCIPDLKLSEENRQIGKWGRVHRDYLNEHHPTQFGTPALSGIFCIYFSKHLALTPRFIINQNVFVLAIHSMGKLWNGK